MIKKLSIPFVLILECSGMLIYFLRMSHDPDKVYWNNYGWTIFYDTSLMLPLCLLSVILAKTNKKDRGIFDEYFLYIIGLFNFILNMAVIAQHYDFIAHTYGLQLSIIGILSTTVIIVRTAFKYGYYK